ncbi:hypothetical protein [Pseudomonas aeruginosa]|uniref:hypothetical protein n=1 Tax=Pseudomonas aeruginosa TaxID=287 RepID=UPI000F5FF108|nr:hypothetical protein [Pseudomonas aeruginosa]RQX77192.1 hypothetical protein IPC927_09845 [Pseudomonas aeruginosa]
MTDHAELRRLAEEVIRIERNEDEPISAAWELFDSAANPKTILALLDEIDGLKAENETLREALFQISSASCSDARSVVIARTALTKGATK